jgi:high-affinity iron transporter
MSLDYVEVIVVVVRESIEAMLVIAIVYACTARLSHDAAKACKQAMLAGIGIGVVLSASLAYVMLAMSEMFDGDAFDLFQAAMMMSAALLMLQTAFWVGGTSRPKLDTAGSIGSAAMIGAVCALAVAREGSETVVFVYGIMATSEGSASLGLAASVAVALLTSVALFAFLQLSRKTVAQRAYFKLSETLLLLLAGSLILSVADRLVGIGLVPTLSPPLWDTSWIVDDRGQLGALLASVAGYRARPELIVLLVLLSYWLAVILMLMRRSVAARK